MSDQSAPTPIEQEGRINIDPSFYMRALEQKNSELLRENTFLTAAIQQIQAEKEEMAKQIDEISRGFSEKPRHNGRVTAKKKGKTNSVQEA